MVLLWMHTRQPMNFRKLFFFVMYSFIVGSLMTGCVSYRVIKAVEGRSLPDTPSEFRVGTTTLQEALQTFGAPDQVAELEGKDVLIYRRSLLSNSGLSFGIPLSDIWGPSFDFSAYGELVRYDVVVLSFTPDGILSEIASEKGSRYPYLKTMRSDMQ
jgi:hypothetical protein